jgi:hypothetical protein
MRPQDLLHKIGFDFSVINPVEHPCITGVQVTADGGGLTADIQLMKSSALGLESIRFGCNKADGRWWRLEDR